MTNATVVALLTRQEENSSAMRIKQWRNCHPPGTHYFSISDGQYTKQEFGRNMLLSQLKCISGPHILPDQQYYFKQEYLSVACSRRHTTGSCVLSYARTTLTLTPWPWYSNLA